MVDNRHRYPHNSCCLCVGVAPFRVLKNAFGDKVPGPTALPCIGNMLDAVKHKGQMHLQIEEYCKRYGDVFGMYLLGSLPTLVISDLDMIKEVLVKDFQAFRDRPVSSLGLLIKRSEFFLKDFWKDFRITPYVSYAYRS